MKVFGKLRLLPVVLLATMSLVVLKVAGLMFDGGYVLADELSRSAPQKISSKTSAQASSQASWAQDMLNYPGGAKGKATTAARSETGEVTGSVSTPPKQESAAPATKPAEEAKPGPGTIVPESGAQVSASERAILERLQSRRQELDRRAQEIELRENLLKASEKRLESRVEELKGIEQRIAAANQRKEEVDNARLKGVVTMYESMKPKDAARIFDRLDMAVLFEVVSLIKPNKMSEILAQMSAEAAERLTVELAKRPGREKAAGLAELPKIEGKPSVQ